MRIGGAVNKCMLAVLFVSVMAFNVVARNQGLNGTQTTLLALTAIPAAYAVARISYETGAERLAEELERRFRATFGGDQWKSE